MLLARAFSSLRMPLRSSLRVRPTSLRTFPGRRASWQRDRLRLAEPSRSSLGEQTRQSVDTLSAFARAVNWTDVAQAQSKLIAGSFLRISQFNARYGQFLLRGMTATATLPRR